MSSFFYDDYVLESANRQLFTYVSGSFGYEGYIKGGLFSEPWPDNYLKMSLEQMSIAFLKLVPIAARVVLWHTILVKERLILQCDNRTTVAIISKGRSKSPPIMKWTYI